MSKIIKRKKKKNWQRVKSGCIIAHYTNLDGKRRHTEPDFTFALFDSIIIIIIVLVVTYVLTILIVIINPNDCRYT